MFKVHYPAYLKALENSLSQNNKFLLSDNISMYDFYIAGHFTNVILNPNYPLAQHCQKAWETDVSERIKEYVGNFKTEMHDYLEKREKCPF